MKHQAVSSSMITSIGHDSDKNVMEVMFKNGKTYTYESVSEEQYDSIVNAESVGKAFNEFKSSRE